ncbi:uncharacterized protein AC631_00550 [Debaryomyces fabryi]|uniref:Nucleolar pre-ribosomal-associated protein 1 C-terminal domain-containing protein n=1 Tax=Debaryomyces fabryi TaxID=58627 RepID=A0A0V1Q5V0_9ASCO|nr:uncharacterized protein AC631_00550 [Debaryomyces fabryi]KSA03738.1 hypothetical protein AC631_00550 [Debaryomyces fabryi]CUM53313.1 unnamed protein product [Debaryomyces fabryi]
MTQIKPNKKDAVRHNVNIDSSVLVRLSTIISSHDKTELTRFITGGLLLKVLTSWSYFASINDHSQFTDISIKLSKASNLIQDYNTSDLKPLLVDFYQHILNNDLKYVYRGLNSGKPLLANSMLNILSNLISFDNGLTNEFLDKFDMTLSTLPKLLVPSKIDLEKFSQFKDKPDNTHLLIRYNFIKFWINLNSKVSSFIRKDLLTNNHKIMNNLWKYMFEIDSVPVLLSVFEFIDSKILDESNFKKSTKCKILNESFFFKIQLIFNRLSDINNDEFTKSFINLLTKLSTDFANGLNYPNFKLWQSSTDNGIPININNKSFRIYNKLIYTTLTSLKPWESHAQLQLVKNILSANIELVPPYMNWLIQNGGGYHDPSLTSWWIGHTLLFKEILCLPTPNLSTEAKINNRIVLENISLAPLSKNSLNKCLESKHYLIVQLSCQLIMFTLIKLTKVLSSNFFIHNNNANKQELIELVFNNLPDFNALVQVLLTVNKAFPEKTDMKLLKLTLTMIINQYQLVYPSSSQTLNKFVSYEINEFINDNQALNSSGYNLSLLDNYLSIQSNQQQENDLKWWNKTNSGNSFFTCLIKLSTSGKIDESFIWKFYRLLNKLTENTIIFNKDLIISPILALIHLFKDSSPSPKIWKLLDEVISRSVKSPYKYLDLSHTKFSDVSLFTIVLFEQFKFILNDSAVNQKELEKIIEWLFNFLKYVIVIGEPKEAIHALLKEYLTTDEKFADIVDRNQLIHMIDFTGTEKVKEDSSYLELLINTSNTNLLTKANVLYKRFPISNFDFAGLFTRLKLITHDEKLRNVDDILVDLVSKLGNYLVTVIPRDLLMVKFILAKKFWQDLIFSPQIDLTAPLPKRVLFVGNLLNEVFQQLPQECFDMNNSEYLNFNEFNLIFFNLFGYSETMPFENQNFIGKFNWVLTNDQIIKLINTIEPKNSLLVTRLYEISMQRSISMSFDNFDNFLSLKLPELNEYETEKKLILSNLIESNLVLFENDELFRQIDIILQNESNYYLLKSLINTEDLIKKNEITYYLIEKSNAGLIKDEFLLCFIGYSISLSLSFSDLEDQKLLDFLNKVTRIALRILAEGNFESKLSWNNLLNILASSVNSNSISTEQKLNLINQAFTYIEKNGFKKSLIPEFGNLIYQMIKSTADLNDDVRLWLHKSMLFVTKKFAETSELSENFLKFLNEVKNIIRLVPSVSSSIWELVPIAVINTQLEVILNHKDWVLDSNVLEFVNCILMSVRNIKHVQYEKLLQIFVNNEFNILNSLPSGKDMRLRFESALILSNLFFMNPSKNSTSVLLEKLVLLYLGSIRLEDLLIKSILVKIEANLVKSWISLILNWELSEETLSDDLELIGEERLILKDKKTLAISLNKNFIKNSIKHEGSNSAVSTLPTSLFNFHSSKVDFKNAWEDAESFYENNTARIEQEYQKTIYDAEFLMMLIVNNHELVQVDSNEEDGETKIKFEIKNLIDSNLLQFIVVSLSNSSELIQNISKALISGILKTLESNDSFKDTNLYKVYLSNILHTLRTPESEIAPLIWYFYSSLIPILSNPGHFLYERSFRYILSNPTIKKHDIPLFAPISMSNSNDLEFENDESHYKQITWLIQNFIDGTKEVADLNILKVRGVIEWVMNLLNSPFITTNIKSLILTFIYTVQKVDQGSDMLITKYAILTNLEQFQQKYNSELSTGDEKARLINEQLKLNIDEISVRFGVSVGSHKRIRTWTSGDLPSYVKRIHKS